MTGSSLNSQRFGRALLLFLAGGLYGSIGGAKTAAQKAVVNEGQASVSQTTEDHAQDSDGSAQQSASTGNKQAGGSFVIAPLPISSPALGSGIVPVLAYIFPLDKGDKTSPPSVVGTAGLVTNNGTRAFVLAGELYFK